MGVRPDYRQTEVGVIPDEWEVSTVGREFEVKLGKMLDAEKNFGVPKPYIGNKAVQWDRIDITDLPTVPMSRSDVERFRLRDGDLLVCEGGEVGRAAIWEGAIAECYYQKALHRLRPLRGFDSRVMAALLRQWSDRGLLINYVTQTSIAHLPRDKFMEVPIPVPPLPEQRAIATALSDADALLGALDRLIAKKRDLKQAAMQQLLTGQTRLPGFRGEWEVKRLGQIAPLQRGFDLPNPKLRSGPYPVVYSNGVLNHHARFMAQGPGVVTGRSGTIGRVTFVEGPYWPHNTALWVTSFRNNDPRFVFYLYTRIGFERFAGGSGVPTLNRNDAHAYEVPVPTARAEQGAIAAVLSDIDAELNALEARHYKTRALKQTMMQELLSGRTRLA